MNQENPKSIISAQSITKIFFEGKNKLIVLGGIDLEVKSKDMLAIVGPSGSGKSTFLHMLSGLDYPTSGKVEIDGVDLRTLSEKNKSMLRNKYLGFIYQFHHLLSEFTALENVAIPLLIGKAELEEAKLQANELLRAVGLGNRTKHKIGELSGGERQRVAIARALVTKPRCVLADEPTGNLDHKTAHQIYDLVFKLQQDFDTAFVIVTHDLTIANKMSKVFTLEDGVFVT